MSFDLSPDSIIYPATGECDKDCLRRNVTEHLSAEGESVDTKARFLAGETFSFAQEKSHLPFPRALAPREEEENAGNGEKARESSSIFSARRPEASFLNVTDVTLILFRAFPGGTKLD